MAGFAAHSLTSKRATPPEAALEAFRTTFWWALGPSVIPLLLTILIPSNRPNDGAATTS